MNIFQRLFGRVAKKEASLPILGLVNYSGYGNLNRTRESVNYYKGWVFAAVRAISEEVASINIQLYRVDRNGNKEHITDHPALNVLKKANNFMDFYTMMERLQSNLELGGNEYWFLEKGTGKIPLEIYPLQPSLVQAVEDQKNYINGYKYTPNKGGDGYLIPKENIIHFKNFNPKSDTMGLSTLEAARTAAETDLAAREYNKMFFENDATPGVVLKFPDSLDAEQQQQVIEAWEQDHKGFKKGFKTAIAHGGMDIVPLANTQRDMEFIEQRKFSRDEILAIFRVPKTIIGILEDVNFASAKTANYVFALRTIYPKMKRIVNTLNEFYLPQFGDSSLIFDFVNPIPEDKQELISYYTAGLNNGWLSINDVRRKEGLPIITNGEDVGRPFSIQPVGAPIEQPTKSIEAPISKIAKNIKEVVKELNQPMPEIVIPMMSAENERLGMIKSKTRDQRINVLEKKISSAMQTLWESQQKRCKKALEEELNKKTWRQIKAKFTLLDKPAEVQLTIDLLTPILQDGINEEGQAALDFLNLDAEYVMGRQAEKYLKQNTKKLAGEVTAETMAQIRASLAAGIDQGESFDELAARIDNLSAFGEYRSMLIARTESIRTSSNADIDAWTESGVVDSMIWYTAEDERVCKDCGDLHGKEIPMGDSFISSSSLMEQGFDDYTGLGIYAPPFHPNCRCTMLPVVSESKTYTPKDKKPDLIKSYLNALQNE